MKAVGYLSVIGIMSLGIFGAAELFTPSPATSQATQSNSNNTLSLGQEVTFINGAVGCPQLDDLNAYNNALLHAQAANDIVGEQNAQTTAENAGCTYGKVGTTGKFLNIGGGMFTPAYQIRLDRDQVAYWFSAGAID